jgi:ABC-type uncharacterized transport system ATPase subunit
MDIKKIAQNISYLITNVALSIVTMMQTNISEMGVAEYSEELDKLEQIKGLFEEIEKSVRKKSLGLKK